jgi:ribosomal-protein-alanine N-acetyltransferase
VNPEIRLRPGTSSDIEELYQIDRACFPPGIAYSRNTLQALLRFPAAACLVGEANGQAVCFIIYETERNSAHIITLDVLQGCRRQGFGSALLLAAELSIGKAGILEISLETAVDNEPTIAFWRKHGYRPFERLHGYYGRRLDAWLMTKRLNSRGERTLK